MEMFCERIASMNPRLPDHYISNRALQAQPLFTLMPLAPASLILCTRWTGFGDRTWRASARAVGAKEVAKQDHPYRSSHTIAAPSIRVSLRL
jgi:hypothetical protein